MSMKSYGDMICQNKPTDQKMDFLPNISEMLEG